MRRQTAIHFLTQRKEAKRDVVLAEPVAGRGDQCVDLTHRERPNVSDGRKDDRKALIDRELDVGQRAFDLAADAGHQIDSTLMIIRNLLQSLGHWAMLRHIRRNEKAFIRKVESDPWIAEYRAVKAEVERTGDDALYADFQRRFKKAERERYS